MGLTKTQLLFLTSPIHLTPLIRGVRLSTLRESVSQEVSEMSKCHCNSQPFDLLVSEFVIVFYFLLFLIKKTYF